MFNLQWEDQWLRMVFFAMECNHVFFPTIVISLVAACIAASLVFLIREYISIHHLRVHHEVAFPIFLQIGVIYGVLLAFIFSLIWEEYSTAEQDIQLENTSIMSLVDISTGLPADVQRAVRKDVGNYLNRVINYEWGGLAHQNIDLQARSLLDILLNTYLNYVPETNKEIIIYSQSLNHLSDIRKYRRLRDYIVKQPRLFRLMGLIIFLGVGLVGISYLFGMDVIWVQALLTGALAGTISSIIAMIILLSNPFYGPLAIRAVDFQETLLKLKEFDEKHKIPNINPPVVRSERTNQPPLAPIY